MVIYRLHKDPKTQKYNHKIDHIFIACLEFRARGSWNTSGSDDLLYISQDDDAEVQLVQLNGTIKRIAFKKGAYVTVLPSNVVTYENEDVIESIFVDEDERSGRQKNNTVV